MKSTPLHLACIRGYTECARTLLAAGAKINVVDNDGNTPMHFASQNSHGDLLKMLLRHDPDLKIKNKKGKMANQLTTDPDIVHLFNIYWE